MVHHKRIASSPGSSRFSNVTRRKRREPGKIYHVNDVGWRGLGRAARARSYASTCKSTRSLKFAHVFALDCDRRYRHIESGPF